MTGEVRESQIVASNPNLENTSDNAILNQNSNDQSNNISQDQLQDFLNTVMQAKRAESATQTEESKKQTALKVESKKQTTVTGAI
jgi:predicted RNA-binding protein Jag